MWFTEVVGNGVSRITPAGVVSHFAALTAASTPTGIAAGPDGNLWFTERAGNKIARISVLGGVTEFALPFANVQPRGIAAGSDGNLWFVEGAGNRIGQITTSGIVTEFATGISLSSGLVDIASGPDGNLWFTEIRATGSAASPQPVLSRNLQPVSPRDRTPTPSPPGRTAISGSVRPPATVSHRSAPASMSSRAPRGVRRGSRGRARALRRGSVEGEPRHRELRAPVDARRLRRRRARRTAPTRRLPATRATSSDVG